jgi:hypothetical protein
MSSSPARASISTSSGHPVGKIRFIAVAASASSAAAALGRSFVSRILASSSRAWIASLWPGPTAVPTNRLTACGVMVWRCGGGAVPPCRGE